MLLVRKIPLCPEFFKKKKPVYFWTFFGPQKIAAILLGKEEDLTWILLTREEEKEGEREREMGERPTLIWNSGRTRRGVKKNSRVTQFWFSSIHPPPLLPPGEQKKQLHIFFGGFGRKWVVILYHS